MNHNKEIISQFIILRDYYSKTEDKFRKIAYDNAIKTLREISYPITINNVKELIKLKGIGKHSIEKIIQYLKTGKIIQVEAILNNPPPLTERERVILELKQIWGVGDVKANEFYMAGIRSIDDLRNHIDYLDNSGRIFLEYFPYLKQRISRKVILIFESSVRVLINKYLSKNYLLEVAGSYRRGSSFSGDVDMIITSPDFSLKDVVTLLEKFYLIKAKLSGGMQKFLGIGNVSRCELEPIYFRFDIEFLPKNEWITGLFYFTGSGDFVRDVRMHAKKMGYKLNEHGLYKNEKKITINSERDIFDILGIKYIDIKNRG